VVEDNFQDETELRVDPLLHEKLSSTRNSMAVSELIINHLCE
jgi:hypothetical protein